jgi:osmotically-inducible protein OsmY
MRINRRSIAVLVLAASLSGGVAAQTPVALDDETIFLAVDEALRGAHALAEARIDVRSQDGYITLSGVADSLEDIATAGVVASRVRGVTGVANHIRVADRPWRA